MTFIAILIFSTLLSMQFVFVIRGVANKNWQLAGYGFLSFVFMMTFLRMVSQVEVWQKIFNY